MTDEQKNKKKGVLPLFIAFIIGAIFGGGVIWLYQSQEPINTSHAPDESEVENEASHEENAQFSDENRAPVVVPPPVETEGSAQIVVPSQEAGGKVDIQYVMFTAPGWVAIHELLADGSFGNVLGAQRFDSGEYSGAVSLLRVTESDKTYAAVLYLDNGDKEFDLGLDVPMRDQNQTIVQTRFNIVK